MYELTVRASFSAAHALRGYPGDCARMHGHNWGVELSVTCASLNSIGIGLDYKILKDELKDALRRWDHHNLNDIPPFDRINPSSENVARILFEEMSARLNREGVQVSAVVIEETCTARVRYTPDRKQA